MFKPWLRHTSSMEPSLLTPGGLCPSSELIGPILSSQHVSSLGVIDRSCVGSHDTSPNFSWYLQELTGHLAQSGEWIAHECLAHSEGKDGWPMSSLSSSMPHLKHA